MKNAWLQHKYFNFFKYISVNVEGVKLVIHILEFPGLAASGDISSKAYTWPIPNTEC